MVMDIERLTGRFGARVRDVDLAQPLDPAIVSAIKAAMDEHGALFFTGQRQLSEEDHLRAARAFGPIHQSEFQSLASKEPNVITLDQTSAKGRGTDRWHSDSTYLRSPPVAGMLQAHILPETGGDTCFASMRAAYEGLSPAIQDFLAPLTASHSPVAAIARTNAPANYGVPEELKTRAPVSHPVIIANPRTGRKMLFVNSAWTIAIDRLTKAESDRILAMLFAHIGSPEYQLRYRWQVFDVALWDNHAVQHFAVPDYTTRGLMQAVRLDGAPPMGVAG